MRVSISKDRMCLDHMVQAMIRRRVYAVLGRLPRYIEEVRLRLDDVRATGGRVQRCTLVLTTNDGQEFVANQAAVGQLAVASAAIDRVAVQLAQWKGRTDQLSGSKQQVLDPAI